MISSRLFDFSRPARWGFRCKSQNRVRGDTGRDTKRLPSIRPSRRSAVRVENCSLNSLNPARRLMETLINSQLKTAAAINRTASPYTFIKLTLNNRQGYITAARLTTINWKAPNIINTAGRVPYRLTSCQKNGVMVPTRAGINLKKSKYIKPLVRCLPISFIFVSPLCFPLKLFFGLFQRSDSYVPPIRP
jgi:hypothetical protein